VGLLKALVLVTRLPVPPWRGDQVRAYPHLRILARRHDVTVCALVLGRVDPVHAAAVVALGVRLEAVSLGLTGAPLALARAAVDDRPLQVLLYRRRRAMARVRALVARERFDVVHAQLVRTGAYWPEGAGPPVVLDLVDALENLRASGTRRGPPPGVGDRGCVSAATTARRARCGDAVVPRPMRARESARPRRAEWSTSTRSARTIRPRPADSSAGTGRFKRDLSTARRRSARRPRDAPEATGTRRRAPDGGGAGAARRRA
jgi:hypothetical protein